jgi:hypothetical protein
LASHRLGVSGQVRALPASALKAGPVVTDYCQSLSEQIRVPGPAVKFRVRVRLGLGQARTLSPTAAGPGTVTELPISVLAATACLACQPSLRTFESESDIQCKRVSDHDCPAPPGRPGPPATVTRAVSADPDSDSVTVPEPHGSSLFRVGSAQAEPRRGPPTLPRAGRGPAGAAAPAGSPAEAAAGY